MGGMEVEGLESEQLVIMDQKSQWEQLKDSNTLKRS